MQSREEIEQQFNDWLKKTYPKIAHDMHEKLISGNEVWLIDIAKGAYLARQGVINNLALQVCSLSTALETAQQPIEYHELKTFFDGVGYEMPGTVLAQLADFCRDQAKARK